MMEEDSSTMEKKDDHAKAECLSAQDRRIIKSGGDGNSDNGNNGDSND